MNRHNHLVALCLSVFAVTTTARSAGAISEVKHYQLAIRECARAGLPPSFCNRIAVGDHNVDKVDWFEMPAHAQTPDGVTLCDGANMTLQFVQDRARRLRLALGALKEAGSDANLQTRETLVDEIGQQLGRALHAIQDNCVHRGISNPHHAWLSLEKDCQGGSRNPDDQTDGQQCASDETGPVMDAVVAVMESMGLAPPDLAVTPKSPLRWANRDDLCEYFGSASDWDGQDRRWDASMMVPATRDAFLAGLRGDSESVNDVCAGGGVAMSAKALDPHEDVSSGPPSCASFELRCASWTAPAAFGSGLVQVDGAVQGCSAASPSTADTGLLAGVALPLLLVRRGRAR